MEYGYGYNAYVYIYNVLLDIYGMDDMENYMGGWTLWI